MSTKLEPPVRFGILSFAHYHANFWSQAILDSPKAALVGFWDDDHARGEAMAKQYDTEFWPDLNTLLEACDAVGITAETARHAELIEQAAAKGCHVLCEKPLATTMADCERIKSAVDRAGVVFMQSFPKRFDPVNHELKRLVESGELGRITLMRVRHGHLYGILKPAHWMNWPHDPHQSGGGALIDEGMHGADFIRWMFGDPDRVMATLSNSVLGGEVEDLGLAVFIYDDGPICELAASVAFAAGENSVEIFGTRGAAVVSGIDLASRDVTQGGYLKVYVVEEGLTDPTTRRWTISDIVPGFKTTPQFHMQNPLNFLAALTRGTTPPNTLEDGARALQMILAAYDAARSGRTVPVPKPNA